MSERRALDTRLHQSSSISFQEFFQCPLKYLGMSSKSLEMPYALY